MTLGELIAQFAEHLYGFWPVRVVSCWEQGVLVRAGQVKRLLTHENGLRGTGFHVFCPGLSEIYVQEANTETIITPMQSHVTYDGQSVAFNFAVRYTLVDLAKMYQSIHEAGATLVAEILASGGDLINTFTYEDAQGELANAVSSDIEAQLEEWGIEVESIRLASFAKARAMRLITGA
jgi:regulator of protease activity HflC (stomatin/prohibitin superfamily)